MTSTLTDEVTKYLNRLDNPSSVRSVLWMVLPISRPRRRPCHIIILRRVYDTLGVLEYLSLHRQSKYCPKRCF
jgi:hypothetical protein